jgi:hypothetical protein
LQKGVAAMKGKDVKVGEGYLAKVSGKQANLPLN